jgi:hypothetical protein
VRGYLADGGRRCTQSVLQNGASRTLSTARMNDPPSFIASLAAADYFALLLAALLTAWVAFVLRSVRTWAREALLAAAFVPVVAVAPFSKQFNVVGWHAFMHASPIYQIMAHGGAPEDPLYAGAALRYPWAEFWLTASVARLTGSNPILLTLLAQTVAYLVFLGAAAWLCAAISEDRGTIGLATLFSAFGISMFHAGLFAEPLGRAFPPLWLETRVVPLDKFLSVTAMPIGYAAMLLAAAAGVRLAAGQGDVRRLLGCSAACTAVAVFIHPLSWLGILVVQGVVALVLLAGPAPRPWRRVGALALSIAVPSALALPYLRAIGASQSSDGWLGLTRPLSLLEAKMADLGFFLAVLLLLGYLLRDDLLARVRARERATLVLLIAIGCLAAAYLLVRAPGRNEYKFLLQLAPLAAPLMALSLRRLLQRQPALALVLLFLLLLPGSRMLGARPWFSVTDPARLEGQYQRALEPTADQLYQWVAANTPANAAFIAADLRMPPLGRRSLFVAVDARWQGRDGWGLARESLLQWHVRRPDAEMHRRQSLATVVLSPDWSAPYPQVMAAIQAAVPGRPIFVHAPWPAVSAKLDATHGFVRRFANAAGTIHEWLPR